MVQWDEVNKSVYKCDFEQVNASVSECASAAVLEFMYTPISQSVLGWSHRGMDSTKTAAEPLSPVCCEVVQTFLQVPLMLRWIEMWGIWRPSHYPELLTILKQWKTTWMFLQCGRTHEGILFPWRCVLGHPKHLGWWYMPRFPSRTLPLPALTSLFHCSVIQF